MYPPWNEPYSDSPSAYQLVPVRPKFNIIWKTPRDHFCTSNSFFVFVISQLFIFQTVSGFQIWAYLEGGSRFPNCLEDALVTILYQENDFAPKQTPANSNIRTPIMLSWRSRDAAPSGGGPRGGGPRGAAALMRRDGPRPSRIWHAPSAWRASCARRPLRSSRRAPRACRAPSACRALCAPRWAPPRVAAASAESCRTGCRWSMPC